VDIYAEYRLQCTVTAGEFGHCGVVKRVSVVFVLCAQNRTVLVHDHCCVPLEYASHSDVEIVVALNGIRRVVSCTDELALYDVQRFKF